MSEKPLFTDALTITVRYKGLNKDIMIDRDMYEARIGFGYLLSIRDVIKEVLEAVDEDRKELSK